MTKTSKVERRALDALDEAAGAAKIAKKLSKDLSGKRARKLREVADETKAVADASKKAVRKNPDKVRKQAEKATDKALKATDRALVAAEEKKLRDAERAAQKKAAEPVAAERQTAAAAEELGALPVAVLRERARTAGRTGYSRLNKAQLIELLS